MGLTADTSDFVYESRQTRREREAKEDVRVGRDGAALKRATASCASGRSTKLRSAADNKPSDSKPSGRSRASDKPEAASRSCNALSPPSSKGDGHSTSATSEHKPDRPEHKPDRSEHKLTDNWKLCYELPPRLTREKCLKPPRWQNGKYRRDVCGSGIEPVRMSFMPSRKKLWCKTPLSMYQATIGELGRAILCHEKIVPRDVQPGPPCNIEAFIMPPCRGYYRQYDCLRPCEERYAYEKAGQKIYRNAVERYWEPCMTREQNGRININEFANHNVYLGKKLRRGNDDIPCW